MKSSLLIGTRKGLLHYKKSLSGWEVQSISFEGIPVSYAYVDLRNGTWWVCLDHGHWGVKLHKSNNEGINWEEIPAPTYPPHCEIKEGVPASNIYMWSMANGGDRYPNRLWIGTEPGGLFMSEDGGKTFELNIGLWRHESRLQGKWMGGGRDNAAIHSIIIDPKDNDHILIGASVAGVFESLDGGITWNGRNKGLRADYLPDPYSEYGHDPHILIAAPSNPSILWQQNHCGIFKSEDYGLKWEDKSEKSNLAKFGFGITVADDNPNQAWVAPAVSDTHRIAIDRKLCICRTDDGGKTWKAFRNGLPQENAFDIIYRHCLVSSGNRVVFGTTTGNLFVSDDRGENWEAISHFLPMIYSIQLF